MEVVLGPLTDTDFVQLRHLCGDWRDRRYPIELEAIFLPGGIHIRATAVYGWPRRSHEAQSDLRAVTVRIAHFVQDVRRLAKALVRPLILSAASNPGPNVFSLSGPSPLLQHEVSIESVAWSESGELWAGAADGALLTFVRSSEGLLDLATRVHEDGEVVALAYDSVHGRLAVGTSRALIVIEADSDRVHVQTDVHVTDVDWDATTGDLIAALDFGRSSPHAIEGCLPIWDSRPVAIWPPDTIRENAEPAASAEPEDYGAQCVAWVGHGTVAVGTTKWESGYVDLLGTCDLVAASNQAGGFLSEWGSVNALAWHPVQGLAVHDNGRVAVWHAPLDMRRGCDEVAYLERRGATSLAWSPDGHLAVGTDDGFILV